MRINAINMAYTKPAMNKSRFMNEPVKNHLEQPQQDTVNFKGLGGILKGGTALGILGLATGAIVSGGTSVLATALYFGISNFIMGGFIGHHIEENKF